ncbi:MAG: hypothetical protein KJ804_08120 [Proteobacteria bacterium]|nr:hypothetical protein [Pseudomonadota bacterium]
MKQLSLIICLFSFFVSLPAYGSNNFVIDFRGEKSIWSGEFLYLRELIERNAPDYARQRITHIMLYANSRNRHSDGYVQLLDDNRRLISEDLLANGYASLPIYEKYQRPAFLYFEKDVSLDRIEFITESYQRDPRQRRENREKRENRFRNQDQLIEIGNFVKTSYESEVKKFSFPSGGFSKINFRVHIGEKHAVIVNSILVLSNQRKLSWKTVGRRLASGDNEFTLDVPEDATDIQVSFAHGQGSSVQIFLLP